MESFIDKGKENMRVEVNGKPPKKFCTFSVTRVHVHFYVACADPGVPVVMQTSGSANSTNSWTVVILTPM